MISKNEAPESILLLFKFSAHNECFLQELAETYGGFVPWNFSDTLQVDFVVVLISHFQPFACSKCIYRLCLFADVGNGRS